VKTFRLILIVAVGLFLVYQRYNSAPSGSGPSLSQSAAHSGADFDEGAVPQKALRVLETIRRTGAPPEGYVGGRVFQNREQRLPADGDYREFDVDPHEGGRNAERIVMDWQTKKAWYTGDHYQTFIPLP